MTGSASIFFGLIIWLLVFMGIAWIINKIIKRRVVNGAFIFFILGVCLYIIYNVIAIHGGGDAETLGRIFGSFVIPLVVAFFVARRFKKKKSQEESPQQAPHE